MRKKLLIVEDDPFTREILKRAMEKGGYQVYESGRLQRVIEIIDSQNIDLILLDLMLPDGEGLDFIFDIRGRTKAPVIIVSSNDDANIKVTGLSRGADDYVVKPFDAAELLARVGANIRRYTADKHPACKPRRLQFGHWVMDRVRYDVVDENGASAHLTPQEYTLLETLLENENKVVRWWELCQVLCAEDEVLSEYDLNITVIGLRRKLGEATENLSCLKTIRDVGYMYESVVKSA